MLTVLVWSPRVAPGLLTARAWDLLRAADAVMVDEPGHPWSASLSASGVTPVVATFDDAVRRAGTASVAWLHSADDTLPVLPDGGTVVDAALELPGSRLLDLVRVMDVLRSPGGCGWDAAQTHQSLLTYLVEEAYEAVEAIETDDLAGLREELGDLLLQVVFHARIGEEHDHDAWTVDDVARGIVDKLVRRHPHVFAGADGSIETQGSAEELEGRWDRLKAAEKGRTSATDGVPMGLPALALASKLHDRAARAGVAPATATSPVDVSDERGLGDALLAIVVASRAAGLDPEAALRDAARRYARDVRDGESAGA